MPDCRRSRPRGSWPGSVLVQTSATTGTGNQLTTDGTWTYYYDHDGNLGQKDSTTGGSSERWIYSYNSVDEMTEAQHYNSGGTLVLTVDYSYDGFGNLIEESAGTLTTKYAVDGWNPNAAPATGNAKFNDWAVLNSGNTLQTRNIFGNDASQILARVDQTGASDPAGTYWDLTDREGSVRDVINNSGTVKDSLAYDAWGNVLSGTNANPTYAGWYQWTGQQRDAETGLQLNDVRWYDPTTGRWQSQDPLGFDAGDSNLYRYVNNRPDVATDPSGEQERTSSSLGFWQTIGIVVTNPLTSAKAVIGAGTDNAASLGYGAVGAAQLMMGSPQAAQTLEKAYELGPLGQTANSPAANATVKGALSVATASTAAAVATVSPRTAVVALGTGALSGCSPRAPYPWRELTPAELVKATAGEKKASAMVSEVRDVVNDDQLWAKVVKYFTEKNPQARNLIRHTVFMENAIEHRGHYRTLLNKVEQGLKTNPVKFRFALDGPKDKQGRASGTAFAGPGGPIYLREAWFGNDNPNIILHEFGRVYLSKELPKDNENTPTVKLSDLEYVENYEQFVQGILENMERIKAQK